MEHEVFIPVPAETLREALRDHARVARCVPGLQQDADESARPLSGRLKVRVGGHTITYRGALTLTERAGVFTAKGEGSEVRGTGSAKLNVRVRLRETAGGTTVAFTATSTSQGRLTEIDSTTSESTARRLLDRFTTALGKPQPAAGPGPATGAAGGVAAAGAGDGAAGDSADSAGSDGSEAGADLDVPVSDTSGRATDGATGAGADRDATASEATPGAGPDTSGAAGDSGGSDAGSDPDVPVSDAAGDEGGDVADPGADDSAPQDPETAPDADAPAPDSDASDVPDPDVPDPGAFDVPVPPSAIDASAGFGATASGDGDFLVPLDPPAEAAHARRTMIGRSAEEVDHAPPRGRYAPEQAADSGGAGAALRWVAPAAALAIAGAVVVGRALRRRR